MRPASGSMSSSLGRSRKAMVFGLSWSTARPAGEGTSAIANSCARSSVPEPTANASNATSSAIGLGLCMGRPSIIAPVAPEIARVDPLRRLVFASIGIARGRRLVARVACSRRGLPILSRWCRLNLLPLHRDLAPIVIVVIAPVTVLIVASSVGVAVAVRPRPLLEAAPGAGHAVIPLRVPHTVSLLAGDQLILGIDDLPVTVDPETFGDGLPGSRRHIS